MHKIIGVYTVVCSYVANAQDKQQCNIVQSDKSDDLVIDHHHGGKYARKRIILFNL